MPTDVVLAVRYRRIISQAPYIGRNTLPAT